MKKWGKFFGGFLVAAVLCAGLFFIWKNAEKNKCADSASFAMDAMINQQVYGKNGKAAIETAERTFRDMENRLSMYQAESDIAAVNAAAGDGKPVPVSAETFELLKQASELSAQSDGAFQITIAPLSMAWNITGETPRVPPQSEIETLLPLVDDSALILSDGTARLAKNGQAIDLGGIAKGAACEAAKQIYDEYGIESALCWVGGSSIYARGNKPDGTAWRLGFRDPKDETVVSVASFEIKDAVFCTSGGYERYFEKDGVQYHHILDPKTGKPAQSDIVSIGILDGNGTKADFLSTALFIQGKEKALEYFANGGEGILLDANDCIYVSAGLKKSFQLKDDKKAIYEVVFLD